MLRPCTTVQRYLRLFAGLEVLRPSGPPYFIPGLYEREVMPYTHDGSPPRLTGVEGKHLAWGPDLVFGRLVGVLTLYTLLTGRCVLDTSS